MSPPTLPTLTAIIGSLSFAAGIGLIALPAYTATITSIAFAEGVSPPALPTYEATIGSIAFAEGVAFTLPDSVVINAINFADDIDFPALPSYALSIASVSFAEGVEPPTIGDYAGMITSLSFAEGVTPPALSDYAATIGSVSFAEGVAFTLPDSVVINAINFADGVDFPNIPNYEGIISTVKFGEDIDYPALPSYEAIIASVKLAEGIALPQISLSATAVVGQIAGGNREERTGEEDPENPMLDGEGLEGVISSLSIDPEALSAISPVQLSGVIRPSLDLSDIEQPIILSGIIEAAVRYLTGAADGPGGRGGGGGNGGREEDPVQRSQISQDISTVARVLQAATATPAAVSGNLVPELGPTPRVDIPDILDKLNEQTNFAKGAPINAGQPGFADALREANQFAERAGGGGRAGGASGALRVTFPTEVLAKLAQEITLATGFLGVNNHLATIVADFATESTLTSMSETLNQIQLATEKTAAAPLVERLVDAGVTIPNDPLDPTNAALTQSPLFDILPQVGLSLLAGFDSIRQNLSEGDFVIDPLHMEQAAAEAMQLTPDLSQMPGSSESNPGYFNILNLPEIQKVEVTNKVQTETEVKGTVPVKHVGALAVTQGGEFVVQLASGGTLPVIVQGGQMSVQISGGLEQLAIELNEIEVALLAVGAI